MVGVRDDGGSGDNGIQIHGSSDESGECLRILGFSAISTATNQAEKSLNRKKDVNDDPQTEQRPSYSGNNIV
ncbi:hypothetical protein GQ457_09G025980 [Hibiscus cannabinus]